MPTTEYLDDEGSVLHGELRNLVDSLDVTTRLVSAGHRVENSRHVGQNRLVINLLNLEILGIQKLCHLQVVLNLLVRRGMTRVLIHALRRREVVSIAKRRSQGSEC